MQIKSPTTPIFLSEKSHRWLENMLKENDRRNKLTKKEEELLKGAKSFDKTVKSLSNG